MKIKVLMYEKGFVETEIPDDFEFLRVTVMSGDEVVEVYRFDSMWGDPYLYGIIDEARGDRLRSFFDVTYFVYPDQVEDWNNRPSEYHLWEKEKFMKTYKGYVGR